MTALHDVVVIGGGLAGAAFARSVALDGRDVVVLERQSGPHDKVCGEFLSGEAVRYLRALGLEPEALGAVPIRSVRLSRGATTSVRALPFPALSLSRRVLDEALLARAAAAGAMLRRGSAVRRLRKDGAVWRALLDDGSEVTARHAVLATGKHDVRGFARPAGGQDDLIGLKAHFRLRDEARDRLRQTVELGLFAGGYAGLELIEDGVANLCLLVRASTFARLGRDWRGVLAELAAGAPQFGALLDGARTLHPRPIAIARTPYGLVRHDSVDGIWRLGDQAAVIPSFAGEGMSIALHSAHVAARAMLRGDDAETYQRRLASDVGRQVALAARISRALVTPAAQSAALALTRLFPSALTAVAAATRIARGRVARAA